MTLTPDHTQVESMKPSNPWSVYAGVEVKKKVPKMKKLKYGYTQADVDSATINYTDTMGKI